jgi:hypothetical protein
MAIRPGFDIRRHPLSLLSNGQLGWSVMHFVAGTFGFTGFIAACFIFARRFTAIGEPAWSRFSLMTGVVFLAGFLAVASGSRGASPYFAVAVLLGFVWLSAAFGKVRATIPA